MSDKEAFRILEMEPVRDKRSIRKAYARLLKIYHPEEQPEKVKIIREAYETALRFCQNSDEEEIIRVDEMEILNRLKEKKKEKKSKEVLEVVTLGQDGEREAVELTKEMEQLFAQIDRKMEGGEEEEQKEELDQALRSLKELANKRLVDLQEWDDFFTSFGEVLTPSVVSIDQQGKVYVGKEAKARNNVNGNCHRRRRLIWW